MKMPKSVLLFIFSMMVNFSCGFCQGIQIIDGWYHINGQKFLVKGIGYETHTRPGQVPWIYSFDADLIAFDLSRIKNAGFNTIRTWGALSKEELEIIEESGLKILFGIWIDPAGDFGDAGFRTQAYNQVNNVLSYSTKFNSIIGYLIMNEPQVQHIYDTGAQPLLELWQSIIDLIHTKHAGIPVSFSNTMVGDYINMEIFDFAGYNAYIYNPVTITKSHGYGGYLDFLKRNRASQLPLIITEYGLSVSPGPPQLEYGYGGNSLAQQTSGNLFMYRELIDAGTQGSCVFQYHDGWWKGGNEYVHDPNPEEWFGLIEFSNLHDQYGIPRPVWAAYETYNRAIITNPKNGQLYKNPLPIEIFSTAEVASFTIREKDSLLFSTAMEGSYYAGELILGLKPEIRDVELIFDFFNSKGDTLKSENIIFLYANPEPELPDIKMLITPDDLVPGSYAYLTLQVTTKPPFTIEDNIINYALHPHIGFDPGLAKTKTMTFTDNNWSSLDNFFIPTETKVATFGAGFTIQYGQFKKRISKQKILMVGDWADPIAAPDLQTGIETKQKREEIGGIKLYQNYPNPFNLSTTIKFEITHNSPLTIKIYDLLGREVITLVDHRFNPGIYQEIWDGKDKDENPSASGVYLIRIQAKEFVQVKKIILLR